MQIPTHHPRLVLLIGLLFAATTQPSVGDEVPRNPAARWWKGNIHTHSLWSDGNDFPDMIAEWYRQHDYNFLALSDHNILSQGQRWMRHSEIIQRGGPDVVNKYVDRFGLNWVETRELRDDDNDYEIRLKPFSEYRALVEQRGQFLMMPGEEISDSVAGAPVHLNATNIVELVQPLGGETVAAAIEANLRAVADQARRTGREMIVHLNHPNFGYAVSAADIAHAVSEKFFEVYNGHPGVNQLGDENHPSVERIWDIANTIRLAQMNAAPLFGVATDDSHEYHGGDVSPGRGWIMVRACHLTPESLIRAMKRGDFYASSGVRLSDVTFDADSREICLVIDAEDGVTYTTQFVGTPRAAVGEPPAEGQSEASGEAVEITDGGSTKPAKSDSAAGGAPSIALSIDSTKVGIVFATEVGDHPTYRLDGSELYVRAIVTSSRDHPNPSYDGQKETAWSQPVGWSIAR